MRLAAGAAGYGMASSLWPMLAVVAIAAAAAGSERRFHYAVVIRVVVVIEARRRSRRHRGCRRRLGNVSGGPQAPIDRALRLSGARSQQQQPTDVRKERARDSSACRKRHPHFAAQYTTGAPWLISVVIRVEIVMGATVLSSGSRLSRTAQLVVRPSEPPFPNRSPANNGTLKRPRRPVSIGAAETDVSLIDQTSAPMSAFFFRGRSNERPEPIHGVRVTIEASSKLRPWLVEVLAFPNAVSFLRTIAVPR